MNDPAFLIAPGEMAALIRAHDWSTTPLGPPEIWPQTLKTVVRLALTTRHPIFIFWGERHLCLYNDAYRASIGPEKHPSILGKPGVVAWPEIWEIIGPQIAKVMRGEGATWHENQLVPILRHGAIQDVFWTYSYGPIDDPSMPAGVGGVLVVCTETTAFVLEERRRHLEIEQLRALFTQASGFMCLLQGPEHVFELANDAYLALVGGRDLLGHRVADVFPDVLDQGFVDLLDRVYQTGEPFVGHAQAIAFRSNLTDQVDERFVDFVYQPIRDASGAVTGIFVQGSDVTARERAEAERGMLLNLVAHDLKSPLTALKVQAQLLTRTIDRHGVPDEASLRESAAAFNGLSDRMTAMVADLDAQARIALRLPVTIERTACDLGPLIAGVVAEQSQLGDGRVIDVDLPGEAIVGAWDPDLMRRAVANLISNAVKYSPTWSPITIRAALEQEWAVMTVRDDGIGIPQADLPRVFDVHYRGSNVGEIEGSGFGLAGVKQIVEQHSGEISIASDVGHGTTVTLRLPLSAPPSGGGS